jgi:E1A/CREB-binding protein
MQELREMLTPIWRKVYEHPDAPPFQIPVDHIALGIPDYVDVVKNPMDLSTMNLKLEKGEYEEPWGFIQDMWLMFENAWLYNKKNSRVYRMCTKLKEEFLRMAEPAMRRNGFCCAQVEFKEIGQFLSMFFLNLWLYEIFCHNLIIYRSLKFSFARF